MGLVVCLLAAWEGQAQRKPSVGYVFPAGGRAGETFQVKLSGQYLDGITQVHFSGGAIQGRLIEHVKPLTGKQINLLQDRRKELEQMLKTAKSSPPGKDADGLNKESEESTPGLDRDSVQKELKEIKLKLANPKNRNRENRQLSEDVILEVTLAPDAEPGRRELRLVTALGLSNPRAFYVGQLPEYVENEEANKNRAAEDLPVWPVIINGQIMPRDVDRFRFQAHQGDPLVIIVKARQLIPYLADAVPGWFQATLALYDADTNEVAYVDDFRFHPDPVLYYEIPKDGFYMIEIRDAIYRGREDFVYRITMGDLPFVTSIFPLGGPGDVPTKVQLKGWNLPEEELTLNPGPQDSGILPVCVRTKGYLSNQVPFALGALPECVEREPNNQAGDGQSVTLPLIVNGRIDPPGDRDVFRFTGRAGSSVVAEIQGRKLDSAIDSVLELTDADGRVLAVNDDYEDKGEGLKTHHADSWLGAKLPADGTYFLHVGDVQNQGGPEFAYRLRLSPPRPDFALRVVPSSLSARGGARIPLDIHALRKDGFSGEIRITLDEAPQGFKLEGGRVPPDQDQARVTLTVPQSTQSEPLRLSLRGHATILGKEIVRPAVPADDLMQAFIYHHLVPAEELRVAILKRGNAKKPEPKAAPKEASRRQTQRVEKAKRP